MKAVVKVKEGSGNLVYQDIPDPQPGPGEVRIKIAFSGICGSDLKFYHWTHRASLKIPIPIVLGHEFSGTVDAVGEGVARVAPGDRVTAEAPKSVCGKCDFCINGDPSFCVSKKTAGLHTDGAMAEYLCIREEIVHKIPQGVTLEEAAMTEPCAIAMHCVYDRGSIKGGDTVVVFGPGTIGLLCLQFAKVNGARVILAGTRRDEKRLAVGRALGTDEVLYADEGDASTRILELTEGRGADCVIEASGSSAALDQAILGCKKKGTVLAVGIFKVGEHPISTLNTLVNNEISLLGCYSSRHLNWPRILRMMQSGQINVKPLITHKFHLTQADEAFACAENLDGIKVLLHP